MNDCSNAEMRDRLPDLLHETLDMSVRAVLVAHVADCGDCREELELLRGLRGVLVIEVPAVNVAQIVVALPKARRADPVRPVQRTWGSWRVAAAVTFLAVGGSSIALLNRNHAVATQTSTIPAAASSVPAAGPPVVGATGSAPSTNLTDPATVSAPSPDAHTTVAAGADVTGDTRLAGLSDQQLRKLLGEIDQLEALPVTEPEPVSIRVNSGTPESAEVVW